jgi:carbohydrate binding protein with CBM11 domain
LTDNRRRRTLAYVVLLIAVAAAAVIAVRTALQHPLPLTGSAPDDGYARVSGVIHVHTTMSDGSGPPSEVIAAAQAAGLGFVVITDHNTLDAKPVEGYHSGVLVLVGSELSTTAGHLLALGIPDPQLRFSGDARDVLDDIHYLGGAAFAAHPWHPRDDFRWTGWQLPGPWGIEIANLDSDWRVSSWMRIGWAALAYGVNRRHGMLSALDVPNDRLQQWDRLLAERQVPAIVGTDAHARIQIGAWSVHQPSYESLFSIARNHVLLTSPLSGDAASDGASVVDALRRGASYAAIDALAPADGFSFTASVDGRRFTMGDYVPLAPNVRLVAGGRVPANATIALFRDGRELTRGNGAIDVAMPGPGVYRVEARVPGWPIPWVITNPIYAFDETARRKRDARADWPGGATAPATAQLLDAFEGSSRFHVGCDASSFAATDVVDSAAGIQGIGAGRLTFRLGAQRDAACELIDRESRDLAGRQGLVFWIRGDGVYRVWVQVRDENAETADRTETWFASVRTSPEWRRVSVPFAAMRSTEPKSDGALDLRNVRAIGFVVDRGAVKLGTAGTIWVDDVGVY